MDFQARSYCKPDLIKDMTTFSGSPFFVLGLVLGLLSPTHSCVATVRSRSISRYIVILHSSLFFGCWTFNILSLNHMNFVPCSGLVR
jgi:hypothetical protein